MLVLPDAHLVALQLLHSTATCVRRHILGHLSRIGAALRRTWTRTGATGQPHLQCTTLCTATYFLAADLLRIAGP